MYVQFNAKLMNKQKKEREKIEMLLASDESDYAQEWIVDGLDDNYEAEPGNAMEGDGSLGPRRSSRLRDLDEDDFESEDEIYENEFEFESDEDHVLEEYGEVREEGGHSTLDS